MHISKKVCNFALANLIKNFELRNLNLNINNYMTRHEQLIEALQRNFGFDSFKGNQEAIINNLMDGKATFVLMPTGGGKSLCYQLPSL